MNILSNKRGSLLVTILFITTLFLTIYTGIISVNLLRQKLYLQQVAKQQALHVAEAGANYYRWHLAHNRTDFFDGGSNPGGPGPYGPYIHNYTDPTGTISGTFSLMVTPPPSGSTLVTIESTGWMDNFPNIKRKIVVSYGIPSLAHYSFLTNTEAWFGPSENLHGEVRSNTGLRIDGMNDSIVTSAVTTYYCPSYHGCSWGSCSSPCTWISSLSRCRCPAVWGAGPNSSLWSFPVSNFDFTSISTNYTDLHTLASTTGDHYNSAGRGYHVVFNSNGTYNISRIDNLNNLRQEDDSGSCKNIAERISSETSIATNKAVPSNGVIYIHDNVWVEGTLNGKVTLVAVNAVPEGSDVIADRKSILIANNLRYLARDDNHMLGLVAQKDIKIYHDAPPDDLIIDGFLLAQNGRVFRNYYCNSGDRIVKNSIEIYGGIISYGMWNFTYVSGATVIDGYRNTNTIYDSNGTYAPPPSFPTTGEYVFISWNEE